MHHRYRWYAIFRDDVDAHDALLQASLERLPRQVDVGSEDEIFAHLGLDPDVSIGFNEQRWFVYDRTHYSEHCQKIDVRYHCDDLVVLERAHS